MNDEGRPGAQSAIPIRGANPRAAFSFSRATQMGQPPPNDMSQTDLALELMKPRPVSEPFKFPRQGVDSKVRIQLLTDSQHANARAEGAKKVRAKHNLTREELEGPIGRELSGDAAAAEVLALATVYPDPIAEGSRHYPKVFRDAEHLRDAVSSDELATLFAAYQLHQYKVGPSARTVGDESNVELWVRRLEEAGDDIPLLSLPLPQLVELASSSLVAISGLFQTIVSQWSSLPDTFRSSLRTSFSDTFSSGGRLVDGQGQARSESLPEPLGVGIRDDMTLEDAVELARLMKSAGG